MYILSVNVVWKTSYDEMIFFCVSNDRDERDVEWIERQEANTHTDKRERFLYTSLLSNKINIQNKVVLNILQNLFNTLLIS